MGTHAQTVVSTMTLMDSVPMNFFSPVQLLERNSTKEHKASVDMPAFYVIAGIVDFE